MNVDPVLIVDDDDVVTVPVVVLDDDDEQKNKEKTVDSQKIETIDLDDKNKEKTVDSQKIETIDLDDKNKEKTVDSQKIETIDLDDDTPTDTASVKVKDKAARIISKLTPKESEASFVKNLRNNRLMDKIVSHCINMEDAVGMPRVIYKTLLPLYRDSIHTFKRSEILRELLKKTYKLLIRDPNHKFLHIKTLCEDLKKGGLWRKVPLVTLATDLKHPLGKFKELTSSSRPMTQNKNENKQSDTVEKINDNTRKRGPAVMRQSNQINSFTTSIKKKKRKRAKRPRIEKEKTDDKEKTIINLDDSDEPVEVNTPSKDQNDVIVVSDKENKAKSRTSSTSDNDQMDYELLIPKAHVEVLPAECVGSHSSDHSHSPDRSRSPDDSHNPNDSHIFIDSKEKLIAQLEREIAIYVPIINKLEQAEVIGSEGIWSSYHQCAQYKEKVVGLYKKICAIQGNREGLVKQSKIRLHVAEGYAAGPAKLLEQYLNSTIRRTGSVEFPNFSDVVKCVAQANVADNLGWSRQRIIEEAVALFRKSGHALRKRRQQREYKDLLKFAGDMEHNDDPAEKDPILLAKLEENKKIAKIKEEEILERFVKLENKTTGTASACDSTVFEDIDSNSSDSESELNITLPNNRTTDTINDQPKISTEFEEDIDSNSSDSESELNITLSNNRTTDTINDQPKIGESATTNNNLVLPSPNTSITVKVESHESICVNNNNLDVTPVSPTSTNPMLMKLLSTPQNKTYLQDNQYQIGESSKMNEVPTNTRSSNSDAAAEHKHCKINDCNKTEKVINSKLVFENSEIVLTEVTVKNERNDKDIQKDVSASNEGVEQDCDSSISEDVVIKTEKHEKGEPLDIQSMLDELGSNFVCQVFDVEDPFLVIEISSDECSDDEL